MVYLSVMSEKKCCFHSELFLSRAGRVCCNRLHAGSRWPLAGLVSCRLLTLSLYRTSVSVSLPSSLAPLRAACPERVPDASAGWGRRARPDPRPSLGIVRWHAFVDVGRPRRYRPSALRCGASRCRVRVGGDSSARSEL